MPRRQQQFSAYQYNFRKQHSGVANRSCLWGVQKVRYIEHPQTLTWQWLIQYDSYGYLRTESYYHVVLGVLDILALFMILSPRNPLLSTYFKAHFLTKPLPKLNFLLLQLAQQTSASILSSSIVMDPFLLRLPSIPTLHCSMKCYNCHGWMVYPSSLLFPTWKPLHPERVCMWKSRRWPQQQSKEDFNKFYCIICQIWHLQKKTIWVASQL